MSVPLTGAGRSWYSGRSGSIRVAAIVGATIVTGRIAMLQLTSDRVTIAVEQRRVLAASRGDFVDRSGQPLAVNDSVADIYIDAKAVADGRRTFGTKDKARLDKAVAHVAAILQLDPVLLAEKLATESRWVQLKRGVASIDAQSIRDLKVGQVTVVDRPRRVYPDARIAGGIVGNVQISRTPTANGAGIDDVAGRSGLEKQFNDQLTGVPGELLTERAPGNREIPSPKRRMIAPVKGTSFVLSIDQALQFRTDTILRRAIQQTGAVGGYIGVMDVQTGDILCSVSMQLDTETGEVKPKGYNAGVIDTYEPGSTMKPFTMAAALDQGTIAPDTHFNVDDHLIMKFRREQKRFKDDVPHKTQFWTMRDILVNSSNVGTIMIAKKLGPEAVNQNLKQFGFGKRTGIGDPISESPGIMRDVKDWSGVDIGTVPIGQGISVSPVQMLTAMNTLAADGEYVTPRLVTTSIAADGKRTVTPVQRRRVVRSETAAELRSVLADVVTSGTGKRAAVRGYDVAGKTGTAQKPEKGHYADNAYVASFAGFYPAKAPRLSILVILDEPLEQYGGLTAAPVFSDMVRLTAQRYRIAPSVDSTDNTDRPQVLVTPELRAVNDPTRKAVAPVRVPTSSIPSSSTPTGSGPSSSGPSSSIPSRVAAPALETVTVESPNVDPPTAAEPTDTTVVSPPVPAAPPSKKKSKSKSSSKSSSKSAAPKSAPQPAPTSAPDTGAVGVAGGAVTEVAQ
jgi:cell division protein FtsI (penicillin-binding protein 3)